METYADLLLALCMGCSNRQLVPTLYTQAQIVAPAARMSTAAVVGAAVGSVSLDPNKSGKQVHFRPSAVSTTSANTGAAPGADAAWTGEGDVLETEFLQGEYAYMLNPYFKDGTRLRISPDRESGFTDQYVLNDKEVEVLGTCDGFVNIRACDPDPNGLVPQGWVRARNLTRAKRAVGLKQRSAAANPRTLKRGATISNLQEQEQDEELDAQGFGRAAGLKSLMMWAGGKKNAGDKRSRAEHKRQLSEEALKMRKKIRQKERTSLDPRKSWLQRWDTAMAIALLFTASVTPFEVGVLSTVPLSQMGRDPLSWVNRVVDTLFIVDTVMQCFIAYQEPLERGGGWVTDNWKIMRRYATSWMPLDVVTAVPVDLIIAGVEAGQGEASGAQSLTVDSVGAETLRIIRVLRLLKLVRILRSSRLVRRWQTYFGLSFAALALVKFIALAVVTAHWFACLWILAGRINPVPPSTPIPDPNAAFGTNWIHRAGLMDASPMELYSVSIYASFSVIFGSSGTIIPSNPFEYFVQTLMLVFGSSVWAYVISSGCGIIATLNPNGVHFRHMMDELNFFAKDKNLPREARVKLREFLTSTVHVHRQSRYDVLLDNLSARLKADTALHWAKETLLSVPYFNGESPLEDEFLASAALALRVRIFSRMEHIPVEQLMIIERGVAVRNGRISAKGFCLGEDMVLNSLTFRDLDPFMALSSVVQVSCLDKGSLEGLLVNYPLARREVRKASFRIAFCRAVVQVARVITQSRSEGVSCTILEAFVTIRKAKRLAVMNHQRISEPIRSLHTNNLVDLSDRIEEIAKDSEESREQILEQLQTLQTQLGTVLQALSASEPGQTPLPAIPSTRPDQSQGKTSTAGTWLQSLVA